MTSFMRGFMRGLDPKNWTPFEASMYGLGIGLLLASIVVRLLQ